MENWIGYCSIISFVRFQDEQESYIGFGMEGGRRVRLQHNTTIDSYPTFLIRRNKCGKAGNLLQSVVFVQSSELQRADEGLQPFRAEPSEQLNQM